MSEPSLSVKNNKLIVKWVILAAFFLIAAVFFTNLSIRTWGKYGFPGDFIIFLGGFAICIIRLNMLRVGKTAADPSFSNSFETSHNVQNIASKSHRERSPFDHSIAGKGYANGEKVNYPYY